MEMTRIIVMLRRCGQECYLKLSRPRQWMEEPRMHIRLLSSQSADSKESVKDSPYFSEIINGPPTQFGMGKIATLTESSVIGSSGKTVALATMAAAADERYSRKSRPTYEDFLRRRCRQSSFAPLTVDYRQRHHAVGKIPPNSKRSDNQRPTTAETLASRAIDRALRPLLLPSDESIHVTCSIQACPVRDGTGGYPVALALNSAAVALRGRLQEAVASVYLSLDHDGKITIDPCTPDDKAIGGLLYAGTRDKVVMMEFAGLLEESRLVDMITLAHGCIQPLLDVQDEAMSLQESETVEEINLESIFSELGLPAPLEIDGKSSSTGDDSEKKDLAERIFQEKLQFCSEQLSMASLRLFGLKNDSTFGAGARKTKPEIHSTDDSSLLSKSQRGRRERAFNEAVASVLKDYSHPNEESPLFIGEDSSLFEDLVDAIHSELLKEGLVSAAVDHKCRADGREGKSSHGCNTIRPISLEVPALPNVVHGSSLFTRGETQVLCTATLGPPKDGIPLNDPFVRPTEELQQEPRLSDELPVGSLRYLKTQEYLESDLNSRKVRADREQTGDSGTLKERQRAFLQYDFPAYSKGEVQTGSGRGANRREIGHGALAEKAILPVLPSPNDFPYAIRITSEVTGSNGSSSMASVCGATLALLDAGVPIVAPVVGLSVGLAKRRGDDDRYQLLLDITGTEDHYGAMDFKIAGTSEKVTAVHFDVHEPLPHSIVFEALGLAKEARGVLLDEMDTQAARSSGSIITNLSPRAELKHSAPRVEVVRFDPMRKKDLLGPGGAVIRQMEDRFNVSLDLTQEGQCLLFGEDKEMVRKARAAVMDLVSDVEVGEVYEGTVIEIRDFGIIIELLRNKEGLCHVSEMARRDEIRGHPNGTIGLLNSLVQIGQKIDVECTAVDPVMGTIRVRPVATLNA